MHAPMVRVGAGMKPVVVSRRVFSGLALGSLLGCDEQPKPRQIESPLPVITSAQPKSVASVETPTVAPARAPLLLFRAYPNLEHALAHVALGEYPTPIEKADRLGNRIGVPNLWIKRDDLSGKLYGGGKTRKLEFYLAEAKMRGATEIVTFGAYGSNQAVATALWGRALGVSVRLMLAPQMPSEFVRKNLYALRKAGATIEVVRDGVGAAEARMLDELARRKNRATYMIPAGGSSPLGNLAFVNAALELADQVRRGDCPAPDCIYMAMGTMGSVIGMALGLALTDLPTEVVAVRASSAETSSEARLWRLAKETIAYMRSLDSAFESLKIDRRRIRFQTRQLGGGYGFPTQSGAKAMRAFEDELGYSLEPTYTAKAFAALMSETKRLADKNVLFWNSHNTRVLDTEGVGPDDFVHELRDYLKAL